MKSHRPPPGLEQVVQGGPTAAAGVPQAGDILGRYVVIGGVGAGSMGVVLAAYDPELDRKVALKLLRPRERSSPEAHARLRARLGKEARALAKVSHPNLISVFDVGEHGMQVFLAMEFMGGGTLGDWLRKEPRSRSNIVKTFIEIGHGLAAAHAQGITHRDFKPENVLFDTSGRPKVADFGLARLLRHPDESADDVVAALDVSGSFDGSLDTAMSRPDAVAGTPAYMAPEQFTRDKIDPRTDQFAFCVALYQALYGERPFAGDDVLAIASSVMTGAIRSAPRDTKVPVWLRRTITRGLARDPDARFPSMGALVEALARDPVATLRRRLLQAAGALLVLGAIAAATFTIGSHRLAIDQAVDTSVAEARSTLAEARTRNRALDQLRSQAFARFDRGRR